MKTTTCAKVNLGLHVTERRPDGYHNLETVFYPIPICDTLEISTDSEDHLSVEGIPVAGAPNDNLVMKVVYLLRNKGFAVPPLSIRLQKNIPSGAGLGGGSSDAAAMMKMLNTEFHLGLSETEMEELLTPLGADCPFFVRCSPVLATGIGNIFSPLSLSLKGKHLLLVKPDDFVSTREAYQGITPRQPETPLAEVISRPVEEWQHIHQATHDRLRSPICRHERQRQQCIRPLLHPTVARHATRLCSALRVYGADVIMTNLNFDLNDTTTDIKKKTYIAPQTATALMDNDSDILTGSIHDTNADGLGVGSGTGENDIIEANAKEQAIWDEVWNRSHQYGN